MSALPRILELDRTTLGEQFEVAPFELGAVVHTPTRRDYHSGNSLFLHEPPTDLGPVLTRWQHEFGHRDDVGRFVIQWEAPTDHEVPAPVASRVADLGLELSHAALMQLGDLQALSRRVDLAPKAAQSDTDWACVGVLLKWINPDGQADFWRWMGAVGFRAAAEAGRATAWLVHRHAEPACLVVVGRGEGVGYIAAVVTHPSHRGHGLATALTHHACEVHRFRYPDDDILLGADPGEAPQRMYEGLGFETVSGWWELTGDAAHVRAVLDAGGATNGAG